MTEKVISESVNSRSVGSPLGYVRRFQDLAVYKKARNLAREIFRASQTFPSEEKFSLTDQMRRASRAVGAQIAEAWAKRRYEKHFVSKLTDADGEQLETQHWLTSAYDCGYLTRDEAHRLGALCLEVGRMLGEMMSKSEQFCQSKTERLQEESPSYGSENPEVFLTDY
jgi:four helix bundle protein